MASKKARKVVSKKEIADKLMPKPKRDATKEECMALQEMQRAVNTRKFEALQIKSNTALIPRGQEVYEEIEAVGRLLANAHHQYLSAVMVDCGYEPGQVATIDLETGKITVVGLPKA